jgi:hypothetical protein
VRQSSGSYDDTMSDTTQPSESTISPVSFTPGRIRFGQVAQDDGTPGALLLVFSSPVGDVCVTIPGENVLDFADGLSAAAAPFVGADAAAPRVPRGRLQLASEMPLTREQRRR